MIWFPVIIQVGVLISGSGSNLQALMDSTRDQNQGICADIVLVISNKADAFGLQRAQAAGVATKVRPTLLPTTVSVFQTALCLMAIK